MQCRFAVNFGTLNTLYNLQRNLNTLGKKTLLGVFPHIFGILTYKENIAYGTNKRWKNLKTEVEKNYALKIIGIGHCREIWIRLSICLGVREPRRLRRVIVTEPLTCLYSRIIFHIHLHILSISIPSHLAAHLK